MGAEFVEALCYDKKCHSNIGAKILESKHNGYGKDAKPLTDKDIRKAKDAVRDHNQNHVMRITIGHRESEQGEDGYSKVIYDYKRKKNSW